MWGFIVSPRIEHLALRSSIVPSSWRLYLYAIVRRMGLHGVGSSSLLSHCIARCLFSWCISLWCASDHNGASGYRLANAIVAGAGVAGVMVVGGGDVYLV